MPRQFVKLFFVKVLVHLPFLYTIYACGFELELPNHQVMLDRVTLMYILFLFF
jgi:hypothetical protein